MPVYDPEKARRAALKRLYGITLEDYASILEKQGGGCAICGKVQENQKRALAVDHLHAPPYTVRGILCAYCNHRLVGRHKDADLLRKVATYLESDTGFYAPAPKKKARKPRKATKRGRTAQQD